MGLSRVRLRRSLFVVALLAVACVTSVPATDHTESPLVAGSDRSSRESATLASMPGSILDTVERVAFDIADDRISVRDVWYVRQPHKLTDGMLIRQTASYRGDVFVRRIIEHSGAESTVVVFPGFSTLPAHAASRFLAMVEIAALNPQMTRHVVAVGPEGIPLEYRPADTGEAVDARTLGARLLDGLIAGQMPVQLYSAYDNLDARSATKPGSPDGGTPGAAAATAARLAAISRDDVRRLLYAPDGTLVGVLDAHGLLVVDRIERDIAAVVAGNDEIGNRVIEQINTLLSNLAVRLGRTNLWADLYENGLEAFGDVNRILSEVDELIGTGTESIFREGMARIEELIEDLIPAAMAAFHASLVDGGVADRATTAAANAVAVVEAVSRTPPGSLIMVEAGVEIAAQLIRSASERPDFNVVVMSGAPEAGHWDERTPSEMIPTAVRAAQSLVNARFVTPADRTDLEVGKQGLTMSLDLAAASVTMAPDTAIVNRRRIDDQSMLVGLAMREGAAAPQIEFYVLKAASERDIAAAVERLAADGSSAHLTAHQTAVLRRWALAVQAAVEL